MTGSFFSSFFSSTLSYFLSSFFSSFLISSFFSYFLCDSTTLEVLSGMRTILEGYLVFLGEGEAYFLNIGWCLIGLLGSLYLEISLPCLRSSMNLTIRLVNRVVCGKYLS